VLEIERKIYKKKQTFDNGTKEKGKKMVAGRT
jgi:hypothetical protein